MRSVFDTMAGQWQGMDCAPVSGTEEDAHVSRVRAVFISDIHLGTAGCQADALLDFLKFHPSDYLYLVGDIVDGWQLRRRWFWPQAGVPRPNRRNF